MKQYSFTTKLLGLVLLPFALFGGPVSLLCVGVDGHFALETGRDGSCETIASCENLHGHDETEVECHGGSHDHSDHAGTEDCCGDCVDFSLQLDAALGRSSGRDSLHGPIVATLPEQSTWTLSALQRRPMAAATGPPSFSASPLSAYLTLRLLI